MPDNREIIARAYYIEKLLSENNYEGIACHLAHLELVDVTVEHLQETDAVGAVYRLFRKCPDRALKKKAKCLLVKWKKFYKNHCLQTEPNQDGAPGNGEKETLENCIVIPEPQRQSFQEPSTPETVDLLSSVDMQSSSSNMRETVCSISVYEVNSERPLEEHCAESQSEPGSNESKEQVQIQKQALRVKCMELICQALTDPDAGSENILDLAKLIEEEIFAVHSGNDKKYKNCIRSKVSNLKNPKNSHLRQQLFSGDLSPKVFAEMTVMEMASDELKQLRASYTESSVQEHQLPRNDNGMQTNKIKCRHCEKFDCTVTMIARGTLFLPGWVRNGNPDEEMMTFVICNACGGKWYHSKWVCL
uniref:Transcription elongation factor A N-terminal and central domain-containing protein n=1 Tax=Geotrypetes seraphini TaxID=260995 RepID=A0A6P8R106_GEOSA|nr:transcription elongation factor A N-terminal and central domain-containing protein [Geotrypetes seraphini]XP_033803532.1 transcription elongation factor A N-terminal and central domain-containing protein [Geotrypetes seraphini]XP_033803533.1 transcription elongation factor A N-terminal and central domain-containing protein [Geotrypetes seraphini]XP_033803534.1 transcription elongation factor A N-terminal and central domain-containing protein [Geotrypetes seraphini]